MKPLLFMAKVRRARRFIRRAVRSRNRLGNCFFFSSFSAHLSNLILRLLTTIYILFYFCCLAVCRATKVRLHKRNIRSFYIFLSSSRRKSFPFPLSRVFFKSATTTEPMSCYHHHHHRHRCCCYHHADESKKSCSKWIMIIK